VLPSVVVYVESVVFMQRHMWCWEQDTSSPVLACWQSYLSECWDCSVGRVRQGVV